MPNHITNILFITGEKKLLKELKGKIYRIEKATEKTWKHEIGDEYPDIEFSGTVPFPKELEGTTSGSPNSIPEEERKRHPELLKKYGAVNWYDWNIKNWGTKWGAYDVEPVQTVEDGLKFIFNTAWSPPTGWLVTTAKLYPSLKFVDNWKDEGGGCGRLTLHYAEGVEEDETVSDHDWYYDFDEAYKEEYDFITKGEYKKVLKRYQDEPELNYDMLRKPLLDRIKDEDLPLFLSFSWYDLKDEFSARLKQGGKSKRKVRWRD
jgi:hypothetical protein